MACGLSAAALYSRRGPFEQGARLLKTLSALPSLSARETVSLAIQRGWLQLAAGDLDEGQEVLRSAVALAEAEGLADLLPLMLLVRGNLDAAAKHLTRGLTLCSALDFLTAEGACYGVLARVTAHRGDFETARTQLDAASARLNTLSTRILHLQQLYNRLEVEHLAGNELGVGMTIMGIKQVADALGLSEQAWFLEQIQQFLSR